MRYFGGKVQSRVPEDEKLDIYERNLERWYESKRKALDIQLTSSIPQQVGTIKTIMWVNLLLLGIGLHIAAERGFVLFVDIWMLFSVSLAVGLLLFSMIRYREKWYGDGDNIQLPHDVYHDEFARVRVLNQLTADTFVSFDENKKRLESVSRFLHVTLWITMMTGLSFIVVVTYAPGENTQEKKEKPMSSKKTPPPPTKDQSGVRPARESEQKITPHQKPKPPKQK